MPNDLFPQHDTGWILGILMAAAVYGVPVRVRRRDFYVLERCYYDLAESAHEPPIPVSRYIEAFEDFAAARAAWNYWEKSGTSPRRAEDGGEAAHILYVVTASTKDAAIKLIEKAGPERGTYRLLDTPWEARIAGRYQWANALKERRAMASEVKPQEL